MNSKHTTLCGAGLACALAIGLPRAARADFEIGVFGGGKFYSDDGRLGRRLQLDAATAFEHGGLFGLRLAYLPIPRLAIEAEIPVAPTHTRGAYDAKGDLVEGSQQSVAVVPLRAHLLVNILTGRVRPFVLLGGGGQLSTQLSPGIVQTDAVGALHAGAGVSVAVQSNWGLRLDGRFILAQGAASPLVPEGELLLAVWGRFGGQPAPPPVAVPPPPPVAAPPPPPLAPPPAADPAGAALQ